MKTIQKLKGEFKWSKNWDLEILNHVPPKPWAEYFKYQDSPDPQRFVTGKGNFTLYRDLHRLYLFPLD